MIPHIITVNDPDAALLRKKAKPVKNIQDVTMEVQTMKRLALDWEQRNPGMRCEGLAAPQVGINLRIIIARQNDVMVPSRLDENSEENPEYVSFNHKHGGNFDPWHVLINPVILKTEGMFQLDTDACLSVPGVVGTSLYPETTLFRFWRPNGTRSPVMVVRGLASAVICHEANHLLGKLYIDDAVNVRLKATDDVLAGVL